MHQFKGELECSVSGYVTRYLFMGRVVISSINVILLHCEAWSFLLGVLSCKLLSPSNIFISLLDLLSSLNSRSCPGIAWQKTQVHIAAFHGILKMNINLWPTPVLMKSKPFKLCWKYTWVRFYCGLLLLSCKKEFRRLRNTSVHGKSVTHSLLSSFTKSLRNVGLGKSSWITKTSFLMT